MLKNQVKKAFSFALAGILSVGALAGCGGNKTENPPITKETEAAGTTAGSGSAEADESGIIDDGGILWDTNTNSYLIEDAVLNGEAPLTLWVDNDEYGAAIVEGFAKHYPTVKVNFQNVLAGDSVNKLVLDGEAGTGGDVFLVPHDHIAKAMNSSVLGMMGRYEDEIRDRFLETAVGVANIDGVLYGTPLTVESIALYYNKTLLEKLAAEGVIDSAEPATDFEQIKALAEKYNNPAANQWTLRWQADDSYYDYMFLSAFGYKLFGPDMNDPDQINFNTPEAINGLKYYQSLRKVWDVAAADANWDYTTIEFAKGETPYLISGPWSRETIDEGAMNNGFEYDITTIPKADGNTVYTFSGVYLACVSPYSKYPGAARVLAMFLASDEMFGYTYGTMGKIPALNEKYAGNIEGLKDDTKIQGVMAQAEFSNPMPSIPEIAYFWEASKTMYVSVWDGLLTPEEAAEKAVNDFDTLRKGAQ